MSLTPEQINSGSAQQNAQTSGQPAKLLAGKYKSVEELESGYGHQQTEAQRIIAERDELKRKAQILEALVRGGGDGRVMPADRIAERRGSALEVLAEQTNVDVATLHAALGEVAAEQLRPITAVMSARQRVAAEFPDFTQFEPEVAQFLSANPEVDAEYQAMVRNPETAAAAMRYARLMRDHFAPRDNGSTTTTAATDASGAAQAAARLDAMIPGGGGAGRGAALEAQQAADIVELRKAAMRDGRGSEAMFAYLAATLGDLSQGH